MKTDEMNLTVVELEELCRLYMDCKLSVLEEKELEYFLSRTSLTSPSIEDVRSIIGIQTIKPTLSKPIIKKKISNWWITAGVAASVAIILGLGVTFLKIDNSTSSVSDSCIAYVNGQEIHGDAALAKIESEDRRVEEFIGRMTAFEEEEQNKIEQFMNNQNDIR